LLLDPAGDVPAWMHLAAAHARLEQGLAEVGFREGVTRKIEEVRGGVRFRLDGRDYNSAREACVRFAWEVGRACLVSPPNGGCPHRPRLWPGGNRPCGHWGGDTDP